MAFEPHNPDYVPTGTNNRDNEYYKKINHVKVAREQVSKKEFIGGLQATTPPSVAPTAALVGETLTCTPAVWPETVTVSRQWYVDGSLIPGAENLTHVSTVAGNYVCRETAVGTSGTGTSNSNTAVAYTNAIRPGTPASGIYGFRKGLGGNIHPIIYGSNSAELKNYANQGGQLDTANLTFNSDDATPWSGGEQVEIDGSPVTAFSTTVGTLTGTVTWNSGTGRYEGTITGFGAFLRDNQGTIEAVQLEPIPPRTIDSVVMGAQADDQVPLTITSPDAEVGDPTYHVLIADGDTAPSAAQIKAGNKADDTAAPDSGNFTWPPSGSTTHTLATGLDGTFRSHVTIDNGSLATPGVSNAQAIDTTVTSNFAVTLVDDYFIWVSTIAQGADLDVPLTADTTNWAVGDEILITYGGGTNWAGAEVFGSATGVSEFTNYGNNAVDRASSFIYTVQAGDPIGQASASVPIVFKTSTDVTATHSVAAHHVKDGTVGPRQYGNVTVDATTATSETTVVGNANNVQLWHMYGLDEIANGGTPPDDGSTATFSNGMALETSQLVTVQRGFVYGRNDDVSVGNYTEVATWPQSKSARCGHLITNIEAS